MIGSNLDTCRRGPSLIILIGYEEREDTWEQARANTHTYTHSVHRDTQDGWSLEQGSDTILTHVSLALQLIKLMGYEHRAVAVGGVGAGNGKHTQTHTQCPL